jgi:dolichol kinase
METIDYTWSEKDSDQETVLEETIDIEASSNEAEKDALPTRHNMQIMRRLFHMGNGFFIATLYLVSFDHSQMVHFLGTIACLLYVVEQVRINYPETAAKLVPFTRFIIRAEEQLKESAMVPFAMAVLLTIITFPKHIALVGIYTLAFADPLSAIIGIRFGKHKISPTRSVEGSGAFFVATFLSCLVILTAYSGGFTFTAFIVSFLLGIICSVFDMIPLNIDDNLTIPLFTSVTLWTICTIFGIYI